MSFMVVFFFVSGLEPVIMSLIKHGDELRTDTHSLQDVVNQVSIDS